MATLPANQDLKSVLDHVRGQFQYHAGQRLITFRYFFIAYGIFAVAYVGTFAPNALGIPSYARLVLTGAALVVTLAFWGLDKRNVQLVETNEKGLKEIETLVSQAFQFQDFNMTEKAERPDKTIIKFGFIMQSLFLFFSLISLGALIRESILAARTFCS